MKDYYYILGIESTATEAEIKSAYHKLALKFHPDKNDGDKFFEDRFKDILEAYDTLAIGEKRIQYDSKFSNQKFGNNYSNDHQKYEEELRRKFEAELRRKEEEIKSKYQTPQQKAAEEAERNRKEDEARRKEAQQKLLNELKQLENSLSAKEKLLNDLKDKAKFIENEIPQIKKFINDLKSKLNTNERTPKDEEFIFNIKQDSAIINVLDTIKKIVHKDEQLICLHILLSYSKSYSVNTDLTDKYPHLLKLITTGKIKHEPLYYVYYKFTKYGKDPKAFEAELVNYLRA